MGMWGLSSSTGAREGLYQLKALVFESYESESHQNDTTPDINTQKIYELVRSDTR